MVLLRWYCIVCWVDRPPFGDAMGTACEQCDNTRGIELVSILSIVDAAELLSSQSLCD
jgi:hypothetical protein